MNIFSLKRFCTKAADSTHTSGIPETICRRFTLSEIERATNRFDPDKVIGDGGFGTVYRGRLDGQDVAIKRWNPATRFNARSHFWNEAELCSQLSHPNLVAFRGFCNDRNEMIRVYEHVPNDTLDHHLFGGTHPTLPWRRRLQICVDVARGLHYLHCGVKHTILHRNLTARSVLLGDDWVAKLTDLGFSRMPKALSNMTGSRASTTIEPSSVSMTSFTLDYAEPEYVKTRQVYEKSDVFSFGVMLLEVLCGRRAIDGYLQEPNLVRWVRERATVDEIVDPCVKGEIDGRCLGMFVEIAESCLFRDRTTRPSMGEVEIRLEEAL